MIIDDNSKLVGLEILSRGIVTSDTGIRPYDRFSNIHKIYEPLRTRD